MTEPSDSDDKRLHAGRVPDLRDGAFGRLPIEERGRRPFWGRPPVKPPSNDPGRPPKGPGSGVVPTSDSGGDTTKKTT